MGKKKKKKMDNMTKLLIPLAVAINMLAYNVLYSTTMVNSGGFHRDNSGGSHLRAGTGGLW